MTTLYIVSLATLALSFGAIVWLQHKTYQQNRERLVAENTALLDRLFQKNNIPPSGVDLTEKYVARQEAEQARRNDPNPPKKQLGPIEQLADRWRKDDLRKVERHNLDATRPRPQFDNN